MKITSQSPGLLFAATLLTAAALPVIPGEAAARRTLAYGPRVQVTGRIQRVEFPGPPNYQDVRKGDAREVYWILRLSQPVDVKGSRGNEFDRPQKNVRELQMALSPEQFPRYRRLLGRKVTVSGTLFGEHTAHHRTPVLISVERIQQSGRR